MLTSQRIEWHRLIAHQQNLTNIPLPDLLTYQAEREKNFIQHAVGITLDFSRQLMTQETLQLLFELAQAVELPACIAKLFKGEKINRTEQQPALHMALRYQGEQSWLVDGKDIMPSIRQVLARMRQFVEEIWSENYRGYTGKPITNIVNIGIGGSDLGPRLVTQALTPFATNKIKCHFVANIDPIELEQTLSELCPEQTLFIIASKSFATQETLYNAERAKTWITLALGEKAIAKHFIAVTAKPERAEAFGIAIPQIYPFWNWVGGRYSLWSGVGLAIALTIGIDNFQQLLAGAAAMDEHFHMAPLADNLPVLLGLVGVWQINFRQMHSLAIIPYAHQLRQLPAYLQQLEMESNGKRVTHQDEVIDYHTAPVIWGGVGTDVQHAFMQLLHQGTGKIAVDFIIAEQTLAQDKKAHRILIANAYAQVQALVQGQYNTELPSYRHQPGNNPCTLIKMQAIEPYTLGALIALYEHKVFVQGCIWNINSFDQWGVELGKELAKKLLYAN
jgi:glucose-6-phosphate isomerase